MSPIRFVLAGPREGFSGHLASMDWHNGVSLLAVSFREAEAAGNVLRHYNAHPEGSQALAHAREVYAALVAGEAAPEAPAPEAPPAPDAGTEPARDTLVDTKLQAALKGLDPANDAHWTKDGQPSIQAVQSALGRGSVTRSVIQAAAPDLNREAAKASQPKE